ncbi:MobA/MobL family protein [Sphingomonas trueperi]|uniref:MobA/MobL family protein n=1 Tax=Sphingomonas trueperi TaxID=53317 RepID=UPI000EB289FE
MRDTAARIHYLREQRAADRAIERFWRRFFAKPQGIKRRAPQPSRKRQTGTMPAGSTKLPAYQGAVIDRLGRQGVFVAVRYYGSKRARIGVARRLVLYITRPDALECDDDGNPTILTNVGEDVAEQATAFDLIETLARSSRGNAKVVFSMVVNLPHDVSPQARRQILEGFCAEAFGLHNLPYVATIHTPPPEGDARNFHAHIAFALRPMHRLGSHEWDVAPRLATEFDGEARFTYLRALFAQTMTEVTQAHGKNRVYTHLSNAARGLRALPLLPLGPALTQAARDGDIVGANERNRQRIADNEALLAKDRARWRAERKVERDAIDARYRPISLPPSRAALPPSPPLEAKPVIVPAAMKGLPNALPEFAPVRTSRMPGLPLAARTQAAPNIQRRPPLPALGEPYRIAIDPAPLPVMKAMPSPSRRSNPPLPILSMDVPIRSGWSQRMADILLLVEQALARRAERQARKQREAARRQRPAAQDISDG